MEQKKTRTHTPSDPSDETLATQCAQGVDEAERILLDRYMQAIYWLPRQAFGAPEETLADFLIYALEKIRARDILAKFDPERRVRFSTWFGVILRNLYLDYLRAQPFEPPTTELQETTAATETEEAQYEIETKLLDVMQLRCRVLFKLLLCNSYLLGAEEIRWIASESGKSVLDISDAIAAMETRLAQSESRLQERYDKLANAYWWKKRYEAQLRKEERTSEHPWSTPTKSMETILRKLSRRQEEYGRLIRELSGTAGIATAPYKDLAAILTIPDGTLASHISRCRSLAAQAFQQIVSDQFREGDEA